VTVVGHATRRVIAAGAVGVVAAVIAAAAGASWSVTALCASDVAEAVFVFSVWMSVRGADAAKTAELSRSVDPSPLAAEAVLLAAGGASLVAVVFALARAGHAGAPERGILTALGVVSVALAWLAVHTVYILRYARLYHAAPEGGIDFGEEPPDYHDFAYLALTIGMTFQVSDTTLTAKRVRRVALHHALLSYVYGAFIVAITVSSVASLLGR
jgi:uncharacterized membrane protein